MSKKSLILFIVLAIITAAYPQFNPAKYSMRQDKKFAKTSVDYSPAGNSISDIVVIGDTVWVGSGKGVSLSTDAGNSWKNFYGSDAFGSENISAMGYNKGTFWVATAHSIESNGSTLPEGSGLKYTTDNGNTWTSISQPLDAQTDTVVVYGNNHLRALPVTVKVQNLVYDIAFTKNTIWIASFAGGLRKSTDMGKTWQRVVLPPDFLDSVKPSDTLNFCLQPVAGKFCSEDNLNYRVFSVVSANDSTLYVGTADGINKSTDNGISWQKFTHTNQTNPISGNFVVALAYNNQTNTIWGATWKAEGQNEFYAGSYSNDGGANWQTALYNEKIHNFGFKGNDIFALTDEGAFRSNDGGSTWLLPNIVKDTKTGITISTNIYYAAASNNNTVWLGSDAGLVKFVETGSLWTGDWTVYFASQKLASTSETYAYPNPFSPRNEQCKIKYSTGGKTEPVTIRIFDFGMHYLRTVIQNAQRGNPSHSVDDSGGVIDYWNGRDDNGNMVPNGVYFYRVDVGSNDPVYGKILVIQ